MLSGAERGGNLKLGHDAHESRFESVLTYYGCDGFYITGSQPPRVVYEIINKSGLENTVIYARTYTIASLDCCL